ncbi:serine/threonine-protein kinase [Frankia sp. CiP1_Cm_nod1]|uniref:serine/threonine-protein kinase n=2 Tax=unclassified Frankia TaxID=2632575 RepID=UPI0020249A33
MIVDRARVAAALPGYDLGGPLGQGAFGLVLAGRHRGLDRPVAIKILAAGRDGAEAGFAPEARLLAALSHPHVVQVYDYAATDGLHLIVMELLDGGSLTRRRAGMPPEDACAVGLAVAAALAYAHGRSVLHRDIKADNILFDATGLLKVVDFGIAKIVEGPDTTASKIIGTPKCMAPEQIAEGRLSPATDLYALGVLLYELFSGAPPFDPQLPLPVLWQHHLHTIPARPSGVPTLIADVVLHALAKNPADRPPSTRAFALDLAHAAAGAFGPGWITRTGIGLRLDDDIRTAGDQPSTAPRAPTPPGTRRDAPPGRPGVPVPVSTDRDLYPTIVRDAGRSWPPTSASDRSAPSEHADPVSSSRRRPRRPRTTALVVSAAATAVLLAIAIAIAVTASRGEDSPAFSVRASPVPQPLGSPLTSHTSWVESIASAPDGHTLASANGDGTIRLWDVSDRTAPRPLGAPLTGHTDRVRSVAFSPDGQTLASASHDHTVRLWDVSDRTAPHPLGVPLTGHTNTVVSVAFAPDGRTLASAGEDRTVRLWDVSDRTAPHPLGVPLTGHTDWVGSVTFAPDGRTLASASGDRTIRLWDVSNRSTPHILGTPLTGHTSWVVSVAFTRDGRTLASASDDHTIRLWDVSDRSAPHPLGAPLTGHTGWVWSVAFTPDGRTLASAGGDRTVRLWDVSDRTAPHPLGTPLTGHTNGVRSVAFTADGRTLASSSDEAIRLWDMG